MVMFVLSFDISIIQYGIYCFGWEDFRYLLVSHVSKKILAETIICLDWNLSGRGFLIPSPIQ